MGCASAPHSLPLLSYLARLDIPCWLLDIQSTAGLALHVVIKLQKIRVTISCRKEAYEKPCPGARIRTATAAQFTVIYNVSMCYLCIEPETLPDALAALSNA